MRQLTLWAVAVQGAVKQIVGSTLNDLDETYMSVTGLTTDSNTTTPTVFSVASDAIPIAVCRTNTTSTHCALMQ